MLDMPLNRLSKNLYRTIHSRSCTPGMHMGELAHPPPPPMPQDPLDSYCVLFLKPEPSEHLPPLTLSETTVIIHAIWVIYNQTLIFFVYTRWTNYVLHDHNLTAWNAWGESWCQGIQVAKMFVSSSGDYSGNNNWYHAINMHYYNYSVFKFIIGKGRRCSKCKFLRTIWECWQ